jgi:glycosyltransferase involved in cell wall biosynthesis
MLVLTYNQQATVGAAIAAALGQTYTNLEIVISDDASTDDTYTAVQAAVAGYRGAHRLVVNRNPRNLGIGGNLNRLVGLSHGELLFVTAGDDVSEPQRCERVVQAWLASNRRLDLIASALVDMDEHGALHEVMTPSDLSTYRNAADWLARPPFVVGAAQAWTRRLYDRFGPLPDAAMGEDRLMVFRAILAGGASTLAEPLVRYRRGGISRRQRAFSAAEVRRALLKNNRGALAELPQLLADARAAGQLDAVHAALTAGLAREHFVRDIFAAPSVGARFALARHAHAVPLAVRLRLLTYAAVPWLFAPLFALKRWHAARST